MRIPWSSVLALSYFSTSASFSEDAVLDNVASCRSFSVTWPLSLLSSVLALSYFSTSASFSEDAVRDNVASCRSISVNWPLSLLSSVLAAAASSRCQLLIVIATDTTTSSEMSFTRFDNVGRHIDRTRRGVGLDSTGATRGGEALDFGYIVCGLPQESCARTELLTSADLSLVALGSTVSRIDSHEGTGLKVKNFETGTGTVR